MSGDADQFVDALEAITARANRERLRKLAEDNGRLLEALRTEGPRCANFAEVYGMGDAPCALREGHPGECIFDYDVL